MLMETRLIKIPTAVPYQRLSATGKYLADMMAVPYPRLTAAGVHASNMLKTKQI